MSSVDEKRYVNCVPDYMEAVWSEIQNKRLRRVMEIGGTTHRSIGQKTLPDFVESYTIADISEDELAHAPAGFDTMVLDACGDVRGHEHKFDLIVSKFCGEHMPDGLKFHRNMHTMLADGGVAIHVVPTLFASPFVINWLFPEALTRSLVRLFQPDRFGDTTAKFPAHYSLCRGSQKYMAEKLSGLGFSEIDVRGYYGHHYYDKIPGLREIEAAISKFCAKRDLSFYTSYAIIKTRK